MPVRLVGGQPTEHAGTGTTGAGFFAACGVGLGEHLR
jgi:hypothetical protein